MALNANKIPGGNGGNRVEQDNLAPGSYPSRLAQIIDLGLQPQRPFQGKEKPPANEIMLTYELVDCFMVDEKGNELEDKPRWISETLPLFNLQADRAKSTQRYYAFDPNEEHGGDFAALITKPITVTVVNNRVGDKVYDNVATVSAMRPRDADKCPELKNPPKVFSLDNPDLTVFNSLPDWIKDKIKKNLNFNNSPLAKALGEPAKKEPSNKEADEEDNDDVPY